ncbi:Crp/Fnr family transcriptional regulator [Salipiger mucosus]|uniref:CrpK, Fnr-type transcriptional regulator n=1 Tax=Salipiger mucosus DSM 16094 TaxID=1123237 RepID=S9QEI6_9RHOB|nr:Crp/Fnr family transcriptional regulator [Salipiger mucosus]EPX78337.1 crpK, Fnr-type transcriptional regulator [Salipiger mucosus DSM 16094]
MCRRQTFQNGQTVLRGGEAAGFVGSVRHGFLRMQKTSQAGNRHTVGLLASGDIFGDTLGHLSDFDIEAATEAEVCMFPQEPFAALLDSAPDLETMIYRKKLADLEHARDWLLILSHQRIRSRLAGFLLTVCTRYGRIDNLLQAVNGHIEMRIPINRLDLACMLGTRPESLSRAFRSLAEAGGIRLLKPDLLRILDVAMLLEDAGDIGPAVARDIEGMLQDLAQRRPAPDRPK